MKQSEPVIHSDPEIMGGLRCSWARGCRSRLCWITSRRVGPFLSSSKISRPLLENRPSRPWSRPRSRSSTVRVLLDCTNVGPVLSCVASYAS